MCFSPNISATFFAIGATLTVLSYINKSLKAEYFYILLGFYTLMELLQTIQYYYVNQCSNSINIFLTELAYILVIVQPLLWNSIYYLRADPSQKNIFILAIILCIVWMIFNILARITYDPNNKKTTKDSCGFFNHPKTCTYRDSNTSHLYWRWKSAYWSDFNANFFMYLCLWFIPAMLVPKFMLTSIAMIIGAFFAFLVTMKYGATISEFPSIWCFISVPILVIGFAKALYLSR